MRVVLQTTWSIIVLLFFAAIGLFAIFIFVVIYDLASLKYMVAKK